jgi:hypothetical protein
MATIGLAFALHSTAFRRANDSKGAQPPEPAIDNRPVPPAEWAGLGYIPDDAQALAGVRVSDALETPAGRTLLNSLGVMDAGQNKLLGVKSADIDHLLIGAGLRALPPRVTAVVRTRGTVGDIRPADAGHTVDQHGRSLVRGRLWGSGPDGAVWRSDRRTLVAALLPEDFDKVPVSPRAEVPLSDLMARLDPAALAWLVATVDANNGTMGAVLAGYLPAAERNSWAKLEKVAVSLKADGTHLTLTADIRCRDAAAADALAGTVAESLAKAGVKLGRADPREQSDPWRRVTSTADAERLAAWLTGLRQR